MKCSYGMGALIGGLMVLMMGAGVMAQDDVSLEELLNDISNTQPPPAATPGAAAPGDEGVPPPPSMEDPSLPMDAAPMEAPAPVEPTPPPTDASLDEILMDESASTPAEPAAPVEDPSMTEAPPMDIPVEEPMPADMAAEPAPVEMDVAAEPVMEPAPATDDAALDDILGAAETPAEPAVEPSMEEIFAEEPAAEPPPAELVEPAQVEEIIAVEETVEVTPDSGAVAEVAELVVEETPAPSKPAAKPEAPKAKPRKGGADPVEALTQTRATQMAAQEEVRRQALEIQGLKSLEAGLQQLELLKYEDAIKSFEDALKNIPARPAMMSERNRAVWGQAAAEFGLAKAILDKPDAKTEDALKHAETAARLAPDNKNYVALSQKLTERYDRELEKAKIPVPVKLRVDVVQKKKSITDLIKEGRQFYEIGDFNAAEAIFEQVLLRDEYNVDAMKFLKKIGERQYKVASRELLATRAEAMAEVRKKWNPPIMEEVTLPTAMPGRTTVSAQSDADKLRKKMDDIIIPSIDFKQANIQAVVDYLSEAARAGDIKDGVGVNIVLNLDLRAENASPGTSPAAAPMDGLDMGGGLGDSLDMGLDSSMDSASAAGVVPAITLNLRRISLHEALKIITEVAGLRYRIDNNIVVITPSGWAAGPVITRLYPVQPSILDVIIERDAPQEQRSDFIELGASKPVVKRGDVKEFFVKAGVPFPQGSSITYNASISQLIVANTAENLEIFERILSQLNVIPNQVEIEARFIEIGENDLEELGLEWILNDNWEIAQKQSSAPFGGRERVQINENDKGFSQALRFFGADKTTGSIQPASTVTRATSASPLGNILSISGVLTNPELTVVLHAISQHGGSDLLSAPRVTSRSGVNATIKVVREIIYPTEFDVTEPTIAASTVSGQGTAGGLVTPPTVTPQGFETRQTGVILNVTPTVGPDGYTIDLVMVPEVCELVDWIQYGSESTAGGQTFIYNIPQPVFSSRNVTTSIVIWDGQTVVMGGLIKEELVTMKDKVPILGDVPLLGYLFQSNGEYSQKKNLLIFVTARLVDPAGKPIHTAETLSMNTVSPASAPDAEAVTTP